MVASHYNHTIRRLDRTGVILGCEDLPILQPTRVFEVAPASTKIQTVARARRLNVQENMVFPCQDQARKLLVREGGGRQLRRE